MLDALFVSVAALLTVATGVFLGIAGILFCWWALRDLLWTLERWRYRIFCWFHPPAHRDHH